MNKEPGLETITSSDSNDRPWIKNLDWRLSVDWETILLEDAYDGFAAMPCGYRVQPLIGQENAEWLAYLALILIQIINCYKTSIALHAMW